MKKKLLLATLAVALVISPLSASGNSPKTFGKIHGQVRLSPICPIEKIPPDPACSPRPYKTTIKIMTATGDRLIKTLSTNSVGYFRATFPVGTYLVKANGALPYPRCASQVIKILPAKNLNLSITCDTGIR